MRIAEVGKKPVRIFLGAAFTRLLMTAVTAASDYGPQSTARSGDHFLVHRTILADPARSDRMWIAISTGGVYRTEDGGKNWQPRNRGICARFLPPDQQYPEWGQCVHKVVSHPSNPDRMFLQHHWGVYRSDDAGDSWNDIGAGLPTDFGFAMEIDPNDANTVYIIPIESDEFRCTPEAKLRVYRTRDAGEPWEALTEGLPQQDAFETILRDGLKADENN